MALHNAAQRAPVHGGEMTDYPQAITPVHHVEPVPRRIRAVLDNRVVLDTTQAKYVWEWPNYPQYYIPLADVAAGLLVDEQTPGRPRTAPVQQMAISAAGGIRPSAHRGG